MTEQQYKDDLADVETVEVPQEKIVEMARKQVQLVGEVTVMGPTEDQGHFDKWDVIKEAEVQDIRWEDGDLHCWFEDEVTIQEQVARATRWQPAECKNHHVPAYLSIVWDMDLEGEIHATIEVERP